MDSVRSAPRSFYSTILICFLLLNFTLLHRAFADRTSAETQTDPVYWVRLSAKDKYERTSIEDLGLHIEGFGDNYVTVYAPQRQLEQLNALGLTDLSFEVLPSPKSFPPRDSQFHDYNETVQALQTLQSQNPDLMTLEDIGRSHEGRIIWNVKLSAQPTTSGIRPAIVFMGAHHAREHLSSEIPLRLVQYLVSQYRQGDVRIKTLLEGREIHIIPIVNPDGKEWDIASSNYRMWRKNRRPVAGAIGVDLNRNYGYGWGGAGASTSPQDETYRGPAAFSEPETQAIKNFIDQRQNISILLSYHTFSELILYPWGDRFDPIPADRDRRVHEVMAQKMATWTGYRAMQSSDLYRAAGDTCDWAYGEHRIFSFTFELDPRSVWDGGFYPGQSVIDGVFRKNIEPALYLIEHSDNPYRVLDASI